MEIIIIIIFIIINNADDDDDTNNNKQKGRYRHFPLQGKSLLPPWIAISLGAGSADASLSFAHPSCARARKHACALTHARARARARSHARAHARARVRQGARMAAGQTI